MLQCETECEKFATKNDRISLEHRFTLETPRNLNVVHSQFSETAQLPPWKPWPQRVGRRLTRYPPFATFFHKAPVGAPSSFHESPARFCGGTRRFTGVEAPWFVPKSDIVVLPKQASAQILHIATENMSKNPKNGKEIMPIQLIADTNGADGKSSVFCGFACRFS